MRRAIGGGNRGGREGKRGWENGWSRAGEYASPLYTSSPTLFGAALKALGLG